MYVPKIKYKKPEFTNGDRFTTQDGISFIGWFFENYKGLFFTGKFPSKKSKQLIELKTVKESEVLPLPVVTESISPTYQQLKTGTFTRYFLKDTRTNKIIEVNGNKFKEQSEFLYNKTLTLPWNITPPIEDTSINGYLLIGSATKNRNTVKKAEQIFPGISQYITDYGQFTPSSKVLEDKNKIQKQSPQSFTIPSPSKSLKSKI